MSWMSLEFATRDREADCYYKNITGEELSLCGPITSKVLAALLGRVANTGLTWGDSQAFRTNF